MSSNLNKIILIMSIFVFLPGNVRAADVNVTCSSGNSGCVASPSGPLFNEQTMAPGDAVVKTVQIVNNHNTDREVVVKFENLDEESSYLAEVLLIEISNDDDTLWVNTLQNTYKEGQLVLSVIPKNSTTEYIFKASFPAGSGNEYQNQKEEFTLFVGFTADQHQDGWLNRNQVHGDSPFNFQAIINAVVEFFQNTLGKKR